jgi:hypothetical protein
VPPFPQTAKVVEGLARLPVQRREIDFGGCHVPFGGPGPLRYGGETCAGRNEYKRNDLRGFRQDTILAHPATMSTN